MKIINILSSCVQRVVLLFIINSALLIALFHNEIFVIAFAVFREAVIPLTKQHCLSVSLYNSLALKNTELLRAYSECDSRVVDLGVLIKYWAKGNYIGDASQGKLHSS